MQKNSVPFLVGSLLVASLVAVRCGGDDTTGSGSAGSSPAAGGSAGTSGAAGGAGGASGGTAGSVVATGGSAAGSAGGAGMAGGFSDSGISDSGVTDSAGDAGAGCPALQPVEDAACTKKQVCQYGATDCACAKGGGQDAGRGWACISTDAGVSLDAAVCPSAPVDGDPCTTRGQRCPIGDAGARCVCAKDAWNCP